MRHWAWVHETHCAHAFCSAYSSSHFPIRVSEWTPLPKVHRPCPSIYLTLQPSPGPCSQLPFALFQENHLPYQKPGNTCPHIYRAIIKNYIVFAQTALQNLKHQMFNASEMSSLILWKKGLYKCDFEENICFACQSWPLLECFPPKAK